MTDTSEHHWRYLDASRPATTLANASLEQLGHMMDTLKDAILIMRHIARNPKLEPAHDDHVMRYEQQKAVRPFVQRVASDVRESPTFTRPDLGRPNVAPEHPDLSAFMNHLHGLMRASSLLVGKSFIIPESIAADVAAYEQAIADYGALLDAHRNPNTGQRDAAQVPTKKMEAFGKRFVPLANRLCDKLEALDSVEVEHEGQRYRLPNWPALNSQLPATCAARMLFTLRTLGRGAADANKRPSEWEYQGRMGNIIGKQSMITDSTSVLIDRMVEAGFPTSVIDINRDKLTTLAGRYTHSFQLASAFMKTANCGYDMLQHDLALWTQFSGGTPDALTIESPADAALLLYAIERRISRDLPSGEAVDLRRSLRRCADAIAPLTSLEDLAQQKNLPMLLKRADALADAQHWPEVRETAALIAHTIPAVQPQRTPG